MITFSRLGYWGQLGNQLFEYAMARSVADRMGCELGLPERPHGVKANGMTELSQAFHLRAQTIPEDYRPPRKKRETVTGYDPDVFRQPKGTDFEGYYQSWRYFWDPQRNTLQHWIREPFLSYRDELVTQGRTAHHSLFDASDHKVLVQVRRGDYLRFQHFHLVLSAEWYIQAVAEADLPPSTVYVVSDGLDWCREAFAWGDAFAPHRTVFLNPQNHWQGLLYLSLADVLVGSASSYAWWGAMLGQLHFGRMPRAIFPDRWYAADHPVCVMDDLLLPTWERRPAIMYSESAA